MSPNPELPLKAIADHRKNWLDTFRSQNSQKAYRYDTDLFLAWLAKHDMQLHQVSRADADRYRAWLEREAVNLKTGRPLSPATISRRVEGAASFLAYLVGEEVYMRNPFALVRRPQVSQESTTRGLTVEEAGRLLRTAENDPDPIVPALVWLFISTGLRLAEVHGADLDSIHDGSQGMTISVRLKGNRPDRMAVPGPAADAIRRYLTARESADSPALFVRKGKRIQRAHMRYILARLCPRAGVPLVSMHGLRHTCATLMLDTGASLGDVQMQLGHRQLSSTVRYDRARRARADRAGNALTAALTGHM